MHALVLQSNGGSGGERIPTHIVIKNSPFIIGKGTPDSPVDCTLYESFISRRHAELRFESDGSCSIRDLGSSNGVYVNKVRVLFRKLVSGDIVQFGGLKNAPVGEVLKSSFASLVYEYDANFSVTRNNKRPIGESKGFEQNKAQCTAIAAVSPALIPANALDATAPMQASFLELKIEREKWNAERNSLKNELEMSKKTIAEMKKACEERSVQIQERDATIAELNAQRSRLQSAQCAANKTAVDLRQRIATLENELNDMRRCVAESDSEVKKLRATIASNAASSANVAAAVPKSGISGETLSNSLQCTLCEDLLVEPVVLTCSHGFCRACIASHWSKAAQKSRNGFAHASSNSGSACRCPRCDAVQPKRPGSKEVAWVRSDHLDNLMWLLVESADQKSRQAYEGKERRHRVTLQGLGIDPDASTVWDAEQRSPDSDGADGGAGSGHGVGAVSSPRAGSDDGVRVSKGSSSGAGVQDGRVGSAPGTTVRGAAVRCEYCWECGHREGSCPHRLYDDDEDGGGGASGSEGSDDDM